MTQLNLLPEKRRQDAIVEWQTRSLLRIFSLVLAVTLVSVAEVVAAAVYVDTKTENVVAAYQASREQLERDEEANELAKRQNEASALLGKIAKNDLHPVLWSSVMLDVHNAIPEGVTVQRIELTESDARIVGQAESREAFREIAPALEATALFTAVDLPLSSLFSEGTIPVDITASFSSNGLTDYQL